MAGAKHVQRIRNLNFLALAFAFLLALLSGWGYLALCKPLVYVGFIGLTATVMVTGPHGSSVIGGALFLIVNTATYYLLFCMIQRGIRSFRRLTT